MCSCDYQVAPSFSWLSTALLPAYQAYHSTVGADYTAAEADQQAALAPALNLSEAAVRGAAGEEATEAQALV